MKKTLAMKSATPYDLAIQQFRIEYLARAVVAAGGNATAAARDIGVHRNTISRAIVAGGYSRRRIKQLVDRHRVDAERRFA